MIEPLEEKLFVPENNDVDLLFSVKSPMTGQVLPLDANDDAEFYIKPSRTTPDDDPEVTVLTRDAGKITFDDPLKMDGKVAIPAVAIEVAGVVWYKLDIIRSGKRRTEKHGQLVIQDV